MRHNYNYAILSFLDVGTKGYNNICTYLMQDVLFAAHPSRLEWFIQFFPGEKYCTGSLVAQSPFHFFRYFCFVDVLGKSERTALVQSPTLNKCLNFFYTYGFWACTDVAVSHFFLQKILRRCGFWRRDKCSKKNSTMRRESKKETWFIVAVCECDALHYFATTSSAHFIHFLVLKWCCW